MAAMSNAHIEDCFIPLQSRLTLMLKTTLSITALALCIAPSSPSRVYPSRATDVPPDALQELHWRLVGPMRAGWASAVAGVPSEPNTYYFGSAGGGVWKTDDAGRTWRG